MNVPDQGNRTMRKILLRSCARSAMAQNQHVRKSNVYYISTRAVKIPDHLAAAWLMAAHVRGLSAAETAHHDSVFPGRSVN
jgi:hypothetical protein